MEDERSCVVCPSCQGSCPALGLCARCWLAAAWSREMGVGVRPMAGLGRAQAVGTAPSVQPEESLRSLLLGLLWTQRPPGAEFSWDATLLPRLPHLG